MLWRPGAGGTDGHAAVVIFGQLEGAVRGARCARIDVEEPIARLEAGGPDAEVPRFDEGDFATARFADFGFFVVSREIDVLVEGANLSEDGTAGDADQLLEADAALAAA